jgi:hypothetical protein
MTNKECIDILTKHNLWRRGADIFNPTLKVKNEMQNPKEIGLAIDHAIEVLKASEWQEIDATTPEKYDCYGVFAFRDKSGEWIFFLGYCDICQEGCPIVDLEYGEEAPYTLEDYTHYKKIGIPKEGE